MWLVAVALFVGWVIGRYAIATNMQRVSSPVGGYAARRLAIARSRVPARLAHACDGAAPTMTELLRDPVTRHAISR
jgi:hypothetical protein